jgi:hypothetical protein
MNGAMGSAHGTDDARNGKGDRIVQVSWLGTVAFGVTAALGTVVPGIDIAALVLALGLFLAGTVVFLLAFLKAVERSREEEVGVMNVFFLDHSAPRPIRRSLLASFVVEIAVAVATAAVRPNTSLAFGILVPIYGLSLAGLWGARHGTFPPRKPRAPKASKQK